jgi:hypothetical protein
MTPTGHWIRLAPLVLLSMTASCATSHRPSVSAPPRLSLPQAATRSCLLDRLPEWPTLADFESAYMARGLRLAECDAARALAVETLLAERALQDRWRGETASRVRNVR